MFHGGGGGVLKKGAGVGFIAMSESKTNWTRIIAILLTIALAIGAMQIVKASTLPSPVPPPITLPPVPVHISWNVSYAQPPYSYVQSTIKPNYPMLYEEFQLLYNTTPVWYGLANQQLTIYIYNATYVNGSASYPKLFYSATSMSNSTGGVTWNFNITYPGTKNGLYASSTYAEWTVAVTMTYDGYQWVIFNFTTAKASLASLIANLTSPTGKLTLLNGYNGYPVWQTVRGLNPVTMMPQNYGAVVMTGFNVMYIWVGQDLSTKFKASPLASTQLFNELTLSFSENYNGKAIISQVLGVNSTAEALTNNGELVFGNSPWAVFGPIWYLPALIYQNGQLIGFDQAGEANPVSFNIGINYTYFNPGTGSQVTVTLYSVTHYPWGGYTSGYIWSGSLLSGGIMAAYDFFNDTLVGVSSLNGYNYGVGAAVPEFVLGIGLISFNAGAVSDIKGNLIAGSAFGLSAYPVSQDSLLFEVMANRTILYGPLPINFLLTPNVVSIPAVEYTGVVTEVPPPGTSSIPTVTPLSVSALNLVVEYQTNVGTWDVADLNLAPLVNYMIQSDTTYEEIPVVYTSLLPVEFYVTLYTPTYSVFSQSPLPAEKAQAVSAALYYGTSTASLSLLATGGVTISGYSDVAIFPSLQMVYNHQGVLSQSPAVLVPLPTLMGDINVVNGAVVGQYLPTLKSAFYRLQLNYVGMQVGVGTFNATYVASSSGITTTVFGSPTTASGQYVVPEFTAYYPPSLYPSTVNNTLYGATAEQSVTLSNGLTLLSEQAYTAVHVYFVKVEFLNLCNEPITSGVVEVSTPFGSFNETIAFSYPYTLLQFPVKVNVWNVPIQVVKPTANFTLIYFGYVMPSVSPVTRQPTGTVTLNATGVNNIYFPLIDITVNVVSTTGYSLPGFVVEALSGVNGQEMVQGITNGTEEFKMNGLITGFSTAEPYGMAIVTDVPINAPYIKPFSYFTLEVRTLYPSVDNAYTYTPQQNALNQSFTAYAEWLNLNQTTTAYTYGTRGELDQNLLIYYNTSYTVPMTATCYEVFKITVPVENLRVYVTDVAGNVLANQPIYPAYPGVAIWSNTTLVLNDQFSPYNLASIWYNETANEVYNQTDFNLIAIAGGLAQFRNLSQTYLYKERAAVASRNYNWVLGNASFVDTAVVLANASNAGPYAVFTLPSYLISGQGTAFRARAFMPGQMFDAKAFYLGYEVFSSVFPVPPANEIALAFSNGTIKYVTSYTVYIGGKATPVPLGSVVLVTSVYPIQFTVTSKSLHYTVPNTVVSLTFYDSLFRGYVNTSNTGFATWGKYFNGLVYPFSSYASAYTTGNLFVTQGSKWIEIRKVIGNALVADYSKEAYNNSASLVYYMLPNLFGASISGTTVTGLPMSNLYSNAKGYYFNVTVGTPTFAIGYSNYAEPFVALDQVPSVTGTTKFAELTNELKTPPATMMVTNAAGNETTFVFTNFGGIPPLSLRSMETYIMVMPGSTIKGAVATIIVTVTNATASYNFTLGTVDVTPQFQAALGRWDPLVVPLTSISLPNLVAELVKTPNQTLSLAKQILSGAAKVTAIYVNVTMMGTGSWTNETNAVLSTGIGGYSTLTSANLYSNTTNTNGVWWWKVVPDSTWAPYFGTPFTVLIPVGSSGVATFDVPTYAPNTAGYTPIMPTNITGRLNSLVSLASELSQAPYTSVGNAVLFAKIARAYVLGTQNTPNLAPAGMLNVYTAGYTPSTLNDIVPTPYVNATTFIVMNAYNVSGGWNTVYAGSQGTVTSNMIVPGVGFGTGAGSWPIYGIYGQVDGTPLYLVDSAQGVVNLPTIALEGISVFNDMTTPAPQPYAIQSLSLKLSGYTFIVNGTAVNSTTYSSPMALPFGEITTVPAKYIYGSSVLANATMKSGYVPVLEFYEPQLNVTFTAVYSYQYNVTYTKATASYHFVLPNGTMISLGSLQGYVKPIVVTASITVPDVFSEIYAGTHLGSGNGYITRGPAVLKGKNDTGFVGPNDIFPTTDGDEFAKIWLNGTATPMAYYSPSIQVQDWNSRPLANQTIAAYFGNQLVALMISGNNGTLLQPLPVSISVTLSANYVASNGAISTVTSSEAEGVPVRYFTANYTSATYDNVTIGITSNTAAQSYGYPTPRIVVYWYDSYLLYLINGARYPYIDVYDTGVQNDITQLGDAFQTQAVRTYVYPVTITVDTVGGQPVSNATVIVTDTATRGFEFMASGVTGDDGSSTIYDIRVSHLLTQQVYSQVPATNFNVTAYAYVPGVGYVPVGASSFSIQRGATVPSSGFNIVMRAVLTPVTIGVSTGLPISASTSLGTVPTGAQLSVAVSEPVYQITGVGGLAKVSKVGTTTVYSGTFTVPSSGQIETPLLPISTSGASISVTENSWMGIPINYAVNYYLGSGNYSAPLQFTVPAAEVSLQYPSSLVPSQATYNLTYNGMNIATLGATGAVVVPALPSGTLGYSLSGSVDGVPITPITVSVSNGQVEPVSIPVGKLAVGFAVAPASSEPYTVNLLYNGMTVASGNTAAVSLVVPTGTYTLTGTLNGVPLSPVTVSVSSGAVAPATFSTGALSVGFTGGLTPQSYTLSLSYNGKTVASGNTAAVSLTLPSGSYTLSGSISNVPYTATVTVSNGTVSTLSIPVAELKVSAVSQNGVAFSNAAINVSYNGVVVASGIGSVDVVLPSGSGYTYTVTVSAYGATSSRTVTLSPGTSYPLTVTLPVSGYMIGNTFVPMSTVILLIVLVVIVIIIVVIALIEYGNWRRKRMAGGLFGPGSK